MVDPGQPEQRMKHVAAVDIADESSPTSRLRAWSGYGCNALWQRIRDSSTALKGISPSCLCCNGVHEALLCILTLAAKQSRRKELHYAWWVESCKTLNYHSRHWRPHVLQSMSDRDASGRGLIALKSLLVWREKRRATMRLCLVLPSYVVLTLTRQLVLPCSLWLLAACCVMTLRERWASSTANLASLSSAEARLWTYTGNVDLKLETTLWKNRSAICIADRHWLPTIVTCWPITPIQSSAIPWKKLSRL